MVGILSTPATFRRLFKQRRGATRPQSRWSPGLRRPRGSSRGWPARGARNEAILRRCLAPILEAGADTIVLACTHYPFVIEAIRSIVGPGVAVIDPAPAIARHLGDVLAQHALLRNVPQPGNHSFVTSGDSGHFEQALFRLTGVGSTVEAVRWTTDVLVPAVPVTPA